MYSHGNYKKKPKNRIVCPYNDSFVIKIPLLVIRRYEVRIIVKNCMQYINNNNNTFYLH